MTTIDITRTEAFLGQVLGDTSGLTTTVLASLGDRLGLWENLHEAGPATPDELATRTGIHPRYAREWLAGMAAPGYLEYDSATGAYTLPPENAPVLADEAGPMFFGGVHQMLHGMVSVYDLLLDAFRTGEGVTQSAYHEDMWDGMERFTAGWFENLLVPVWLPAMPDVLALLEAGADVADVGCGRGRALIRLAEQFPRSRFVGFDAFAPTIERAATHAADAGVAERVRFEHRDAAAGLPGTYDVVFTFDVVHDAVDPLGLLRAIRASLRPSGIYVCLDINCSDRPEENVGPLASFFYGASILYCMTTSLAGGGAALGTCGLPEPTLAQLGADAGFVSVRRVPLDNPFNNLYEARP